MFYTSVLIEIKLSLFFGSRNRFSVTGGKKIQEGLKFFESIKNKWDNEVHKAVSIDFYEVKGCIYYVNNSIRSMRYARTALL